MADLWDAMFSRSGLLLAEATRIKESGDMDGAIAKLREAYRAAAEEQIDHGIQTHLRLPLYLYRAGRGDEAWAEFNRLAIEGYPGESNRTREIIAINLSVIFDKMRLTLQRDKMHGQAVRFGVWSILCTIGEFSTISHLSKDWIETEIAKLLKKAKRPDLLPEILGLVDNELKRNGFNLPIIGDQIDALFGIDRAPYFPELP